MSPLHVQCLSLSPLIFSFSSLISSNAWSSYLQISGYIAMNINAQRHQRSLLYLIPTQVISSIIYYRIYIGTATEYIDRLKQSSEPTCLPLAPQFHAVCRVVLACWKYAVLFYTTFPLFVRCLPEKWHFPARPRKPKMASFTPKPRHAMGLRDQHGLRAFESALWKQTCAGSRIRVAT